MAVLVQTGGKIKLTPPEYEQLINYTMLYNSGDECTDVTGGWSQGTKVLGDNLGTVIFNTNSVRCYCTASGYKDDARMSTDSPIALNGEYNKLWSIFKNISITGTNTAVNGAMIHMSVSKTRSATEYGDTKLLTSLPSLADIVYCGNPLNTAPNYADNGLDLSVLSGEYYVNIGMFRGADTSGTGQFDISNVFFTKEDDITTLCTKAGISAPTSLDTLLADSTSLTAIFNSEDAVNFMVKQCTGDFMVGVLNSTDAVSILKTSPYLNTVIGNPHWAKFMMMIPTAQELL